MKSLTLWIVAEIFGALNENIMAKYLLVDLDQETQGKRGAGMKNY